ncbi:phage tail protein [Tumebacillus permanentifrigoris]|uniref:Phage tail-like protein n=1 Tax=Tumebacillus permanentifrigoris TaxID=378543 RepID=A0A316D730_9BACL|nr:phage tail protein [Tumebacillus permanentifrigoris]PWK11534.1 phage tail-like protein [Tumebacillus permanentifrigoris]
MYENTTFFSLNKARDWQQGTYHNLHLSDEGVRLERTVRYGRRSDIWLNQIEGMGSVADLTLGPRGTLLLLDHEAKVWLYDYVNRISDSLFPPEHNLFTNRAVLGATEDLVVVAERQQRGRITAYSLSNIQAVWEVREWQGQEICPLAMGTDGEHEVYVVIPEQTVAAESGRIVPAGTALVVLQIGDGGRLRHVYRDEALTVPQATRLEELWQRFSLQVQHKGRWLYLLDGDTRRVHVFHRNGGLDRHVEIEFPGIPSALAVDTRDTLYVSDGRELSSGSLDDRFVHTYQADGEPSEPLSGSQGEVGKILYGHQHLLYLWYRAENRIAVLEQSPRIQGAGQLGGAPEGVYFSRAFDAVASETVWHKLLLDADLPDETQLRVYYIASDHPEVWVDGGTLPLDHFLHNEQTLQEKLERTRNLWQGPIVNPRDALLRAQGRFLWLRIEWSGSDRKTPLLKKLRVYYPRVSYLQYLPAVFQQDPQSRDFMERFLSLFGTFFDEMEEAIDHIARCFDADAATGDLLKWLSTWLGIAVDDRWTEEQTRALLKRAPDLYQKRGTREGLQDLFEIFTGEKPYIVEFFQYKYLIEKAEIRRTMERLYGLDPYRFCVLVKPDVVPDERSRAILQKLLDEERPAFTEAQLIVLEPHIHMGSHAYLGINSFLMEPSLLVLDDKAALPYNTVLVDVDRNSRIGLHSRLGMDSTLE